MRYFKNSRFIRLVILPIALVSMSACQTTQWKSAGFAPFDTRRELPSPARLTLNDASTIELVGAQFEADSVVGTRTAGVVTTSARWAVHVDSVRHIERLEVYGSVGRNALLVGAGVFAVGVVITLVNMDKELGKLGE